MLSSIYFLHMALAATLVGVGKTIFQDYPYAYFPSVWLEYILLTHQLFDSIHVHCELHALFSLYALDGMMYAGLLKQAVVIIMYTSKLYVCISLQPECPKFGSLPI